MCIKLWRFRVVVIAVETRQCILCFFFFSTLSQKGNYFRSEFIEGKMRVFIFSVTFTKDCLIRGWIQINIIINVRRFSSEVPVIPVRFESNLIFPRQIFEPSSYIKFRRCPSSGRRVVPSRRAYVAENRFSQCRERA